MIWKVHISVSVDAPICVCLLMYITKNSLFICRGKNSPLCVGQCLGTLELPREVVEPSALETLGWVRALGSLSFEIGLGSAAVLGRWLAQVTSRGPFLHYHCSAVSKSVLFSVWCRRVWRLRTEVIFWLPWSIKNTRTPCPSRVASLSLTLVVGMCSFYWDLSVRSCVVNINYGIMCLPYTWELL